MPDYTGFRQNGIPFDDLYVKYSNFNSGGLWLWGLNLRGSLGDNTRINRSSPVQTISRSSNWKLVATGSGQNAEVTIGIKTDGTLWNWGYGRFGVLGDLSNTHKSSPVQTVSGGTNWLTCDTGGDHSAGIKTDGSLWLWGINYRGFLGDNTVTAKSSPVQTVAGGNNWKQVSCARKVTAAIKLDGTLWTWGDNGWGSLGHNTTIGAAGHKSSPTQVVGSGSPWKQVSCSPANMAAVKTDGTLWVWGYNGYGQIGDNTNNNPNGYSSPVQTVAGGTNWKSVSIGSSTCAAIKTDGTLWTWGQNNTASCGDNTLIHRSSPVQTVSGGTNWKQVSGSAVVAAIKTDGTLWTWGWGTNGQLGDNTVTPKSSPVQTVASGNNWKLVAVNDQSSLVTAIRDSW